MKSASSTDRTATKKRKEKRGRIRNIYGDYFMAEGRGTTVYKKNAHIYVWRRLSDHLRKRIALGRLSFEEIKR